MTDVSFERAITISSQLSQTGSVAESLMEFTTNADVPEADSRKMQLAVIEWLNNVIIHGDDPKSTITLSLLVLGRTLSVTIADQNAALSADFWEQPHDCPNPLDLPEGGWGMHIIQSIVDRIEFRASDRGNQLTLHLDY